ncbi:MAG: glycosyltransferase family 4 protein [Nitrospirae bacterium]|nr:MAG: glycosyltransferase family 4 protein [Nitrospirota bacterium]
MWPTRGIFVLERMRAVAGSPNLRLDVMAPVPYYPSIAVGWRRAFARVPRMERIEGFDVYHPRYFMTPKIGMTFYGLSMGLCSVPAMRAVTRSAPIDLIDAHFAYPDGVAAALLSRMIGVPLILTVRGSDINVSAQLPVIKPWVRWALRIARHVVAVSQALAERVAELGVAREKIAVIPNGIDPHKFYAMPREEARAKLGVPKNRPMILSVGNLAAHKGMDVLIEAMHHFRETEAIKTGTGKEPLLYLIGEGPDRIALERKIRDFALEDSVRLVGSLPHHELVLWYNAADLFCLASQREGCPNVVKEALACGTPVLASPVGGMPEILHSPSMGVLVPRSARAFASAMRDALMREWDRQAISRLGQEQTWDRVGQRIRELFASARQAHA